MFVIADIEWVTNLKRKEAPVQLAAIKVDEAWRSKDTFVSFIKPQNESFHKWEHMAYSGGTEADFLEAKSVHRVLDMFERWLGDDDIILWWHPDSMRLYDKIVRNVLKKENKHKSVYACDYVYKVCKSKEKNLYKVAESCGVGIKLPQHYALNDAEVLRGLLRKLKLPQGVLEDEEVLKKTEKDKLGKDIRYVYEVKENLIHKRDCEKISYDEPVIGYQLLRKAIKVGYKICACCKEDYREAIKSKNEGILKYSDFAYIYLPESEVFHTRECKSLCYSKNLMGTHSFESVAKLGKRACKLCRPEANNVKFTIPRKLVTDHYENYLNNNLGKNERKAVLRHRRAVEDREKLLRKENITPQEKNDIYTLTQPGYAFWAARGYQNFHLWGCARLNNVSDIKGFATFREATSCNLTPCRVCKPTAKHDVCLSIPITSKVRKDESFYCLEDKAERAGFEYEETKEFISIFTPVGRWRIFHKKFPIRVEHINLMYGEEADYHEQPRRFLSFTDTFDYIKRHDRNLMESGGRDINTLISLRMSAK